MTLFNENRPMNVATYTLATLPQVVTGDLIFVSDANSGAGAMCFGSVGLPEEWIDIRTAAAVA